MKLFCLSGHNEQSANKKLNVCTTAVIGLNLYECLKDNEIIRISTTISDSDKALQKAQQFTRNQVSGWDLD